MRRADERLAAEYALGVLDASRHRAAARRLVGDADFRECVRLWQRRLTALEPVAEETPGEGVWARIEEALDDLQAVPGTRTVRRDAGAWQTLAPGIEKKLLHVDPAGGTQSYLIRLAPGAALPPHGHRAAEECVVLEGELCVGERTLGPGGYHLAPAGVQHPSLHTRTGAVFFIRGAL